MNVVLRPEHEKFIAEQLRTGRFTSVEDAVAVALERFIEEQVGEHDPADLAAVEEGLAQAARGEGYTLEQVKEQLRGRGIDIR